MAETLSDAINEVESFFDGFPPGEAPRDEWAMVKLALAVQRHPSLGARFLRQVADRLAASDGMPGETDDDVTRLHAIAGALESRLPAE